MIVATRRGDVVVARPAVVAVREVPPAVRRRAPWPDVARLENLCADAWPAVTERRLGAWRLRAAGGFTGRANAALAIGDPGVGTAAALARVRGFAEEHAIAARVLTPVGSPWSRAVEAQSWVPDAGYLPGPVVSVQVLACDAVADSPPSRSTSVPGPIPAGGASCTAARPTTSRGASSRRGPGVRGTPSPVRPVRPPARSGWPSSTTTCTSRGSSSSPRRDVRAPAPR
ncbi:hypothetical protein ACFQV8_32105 [Pseudonocardia benzenivorans]